MTGKKFLHPGDPSTRSVSTFPGGRTLRLPHAVAGQARLASLLRHYRALESESDIARLLTPPGEMRATVSSGTHDAICRVYDDLWDQPPPEDSLAERAAATAARAPAALLAHRLTERRYPGVAARLHALALAVRTSRGCRSRRRRAGPPSTPDRRPRIVGPGHSHPKATGKTPLPPAANTS